MNQMPTKKILVAFVGILLVAGLAACPSKMQRYMDKARQLGLSMNRPCNFYGQILDQNNQPVVGVTIRFGLAHYTADLRPSLEAHCDKFERTSDNSGRFSVEGEKGVSINMELQPKDGFEFRPDYLGVSLLEVAQNDLSASDKPYVFHAFKMGKAEPLIQVGLTKYDCVPDGRFYVTQLRDNRITEGNKSGELKISVRRPSGQIYKIDYDWSVQIDGVDMELQETHDVFMYQAPESGYVSSWGFSRKAGEKDYTRKVKAQFYIKSRNGSVFGRIEIEIISDWHEASCLTIGGWLNPSGSRNLQPSH
jgi:hypothetical protein